MGGDDRAVTNDLLAKGYIERARKRLRALDVLFEEEAYPDVIRESQEVVELALKGMLRHVGIDPPHWHDVGRIVLEHAAKFPASVRESLPAIAAVSKALRREREMSFHGDIDFIPEEEYSRGHASSARDDARHVVEVAESVLRAV